MIGRLRGRIFGNDRNISEIEEGPDVIFDFLLRAEFERDFENVIEYMRIPDGELNNLHKFVIQNFREKYIPNGNCPSVSYWRATEFQRRCYDGIHEGICRQLYGDE
jgi:hypothetical protein